MNIGAVARASGLSTQAIRFYERMGLIKPARAANGYRVYAAHHLEQLGFIQRARGLGLPLAEIAQLTNVLGEQNCACGQLQEVLPRKIQQLDTQIAELTKLRADLQRYMDRLAPDPTSGRRPGCWAEALPARA